MQRYDIYANPKGKRTAVKQGWSWPAFFFTAFWAVTKNLHGIYLLLLFLVPFVIVFVFVETEQPAVIGWAALFYWLAAPIWLGLKGNEYLANKLQRKKYELIDSVSARSSEAAVAEYRTGR